MKQLIKKLYASSVVRYVFFGGCTTLVNLISFYVLRKLRVGLNIANVISIILAILFAYVVNSRFVFQDKCQTLADHIRPLLQVYQCPSYDHGHRGRRRLVVGGKTGNE